MQGQKKNSKLSWGIQIAVGATYAIFFMVQIFFNLCINQAANPKTAYSPAGKLTSSQNCLIQRDDSGKQYNNALRLNKRFQPAASPIALLEVEPSPIKFSKIATLQRPYDYVLFSIVLAKSLRGPPFIIA